MAVGSKPLGEVLVDERLLSREQLQQALIRQKETGQPLGKILLEMGLVEEKSLVEAVSKQIGVAFVDLEDPRLDPTVVELIPLEFARSREAIPVRIDGNALVVAMAHPANRQTVEAIAEMTGYEVVPALAVRRHLLIALERIATMPPDQPSYEEEVLQEMVPAGELAAVTKEIHIHELLERALTDNASDLHLTVGTPPVMRIHGKLVRL